MASEVVRWSDLKQNDREAMTTIELEGFKLIEKNLEGSSKDWAELFKNMIALNALIVTLRIQGLSKRGLRSLRMTANECERILRRILQEKEAAL